MERGLVLPYLAGTKGLVCPTGRDQGPVGCCPNGTPPWLTTHNCYYTIHLPTTYTHDTHTHHTHLHTTHTQTGTMPRKLTLGATCTQCWLCPPTKLNVTCVSLTARNGLRSVIHISDSLWPLLVVTDHASQLLTVVFTVLVMLGT